MYLPSVKNKIINPPVDKPTSVVDKLAFASHTPPISSPTAEELFQETGISIPPVEHVDSPTYASTKPPTDIANKLFFIQYTPENILCHRWYLVQVDMESTLTVNPNYKENGEY